MLGTARRKRSLLPEAANIYNAGEIQPTKGRSPATLTRLAMNREQKTRAILAELGIPPESAAVSLNAAKEALLKCMPTLKGEAKTQQQLFTLATVPSPTTGRKAINALLAAGEIERVGKGVKGDEYCYFRTQQESDAQA